MRSWIKKTDIPAHKIGKLWKFKRFELDEWIKSGGSVLSSFVQIKPFYTAFHIMVLEPKKQMTLQEKLFYCMCIKKNAYRYSYGRQANKTLKNIIIPDSVPDWVNKTEISAISTKNRKELYKLNIEGWLEYRLDELFIFSKGTLLGFG